MSPQALIILAAFGGVVAGFIIAKLFGGSNNEQPLLEAEERFNKLKDEFDAYRSQVDKHFVDTADAVDELNRSYKNVMQHLSFGAHGLMGASALQEQLALRGDKAVTVSYLANVAEEEAEVEETTETVEEVVTQAPEAIEEAVAEQSIDETTEVAEEKVEEIVATVEEKAEEANEVVEEKVEAVEEQAQEATATVEEIVETAEEKIQEISDVAEEAVKEAEQAVAEVAQTAEQAIEETVEAEKK